MCLKLGSQQSVFSNAPQRTFLSRCSPSRIYPHISAATLDTIHRLFQILEHPPTNTELASSDDHVFELLKGTLTEQIFGNEDKVKEALHLWLKDNQKHLFWWH